MKSNSSNISYPQHAFVDTKEEGEARVMLYDNVAFFGSEFTFLGVSGIAPISLQESLATYLAFGLQKDSEFTETFNHFLLRLKEGGFLETLKQKWIPYASESDSLQQEQEVSLHVSVYYPFVLVAIGILIGVGMVLLEFMFSMKHDIELSNQTSMPQSPEGGTEKLP